MENHGPLPVDAPTSRISNPLVKVELVEISEDILAKPLQLPRHRQSLEYIKHQINAILQTEDLELPTISNKEVPLEDV